MRRDVLALPQETSAMQEEPAPQSASLVQNFRQVLTGCATVEQVVNSKHPEPGTQSVVSVQGSPGFALPAEKQSRFGWEFWSQTRAQVYPSPQVVAGAIGSQVGGVTVTVV
jgi:hypothetical protein